KGWSLARDDPELFENAAKLLFAHRERAHDARIELAAGPAEDLFRRPIPVERCAVRPVARHRVERVGKREDTRADRDVVAGEPVGISPPVPALVMRADDVEPR